MTTTDASLPFEGIAPAAVGLAFGLLNLYAIVRIVRRAGYSGWWVLLAFVPVVGYVLFLMFAFRPWPVESRGRLNSYQPLHPVVHGQGPLAPKPDTPPLPPLVVDEPPQPQPLPPLVVDEPEGPRPPAPGAVSW